MPLTTTVEIVGLREFYAKLAEVRGQKLAKTAQTSVSTGLRKVVVPAIKNAAHFKGHGHGPNHGPAGRLLKAIASRVAKKRPGEMFALRVGPTGKRGPQNAWYAHFVLRGTKAHLITPGGQGGGSFSSAVRRANRGNALALSVAGNLRAVVHHPGAQPNNFLRAGLGHDKELNDQLLRDLIAAMERGHS
jgi:hypothetical protein